MYTYTPVDSNNKNHQPDHEFETCMNQYLAADRIVICIWTINHHGPLQYCFLNRSIYTVITRVTSTKVIIF